MSISKDEVIKNLDQVKDFVKEIEQDKKETKKIGIQIKNRWTGDIIYESEKTTYKEAVEEAIESKANLSEANLSGADLYRANLSEADLSGADLYRAKFWGKTNNPIILKGKQVDNFLTALGFKRE